MSVSVIALTSGCASQPNKPREIYSSPPVDLRLASDSSHCAFAHITPELIAGAVRSRGYGHETVTKIIDVLQSVPNVGGDLTALTVYRKARFGNAMAGLTDDRQRIVIYDGRWTNVMREKFSGGASIGVFAHEIGHHCHLNRDGSVRETPFTSAVRSLAGDNKRWLAELEADFTAGFVLARMGVTVEHAGNFMDALAAMEQKKKQDTGEGSYTHPPIQRRRKALHLGWKHGGGEAYSKSANWCPCGCNKAENRYDESYEKTPDNYRNEDKIYANTVEPVQAAPPVGVSSVQIQQIPVPCSHPHPMNPYYPAHPFDWYPVVITVSTGTSEGD
ncbi:MAG: hypothetical protein JNG88_00770 [Phycisphaerales bacterium]|nr:hypothetical protein [Phycisphaerales bacterium]